MGRRGAGTGVSRPVRPSARAGNGPAGARQRLPRAGSFSRSPSVEPDAVVQALSAQRPPAGGVEELIARALARRRLPLLPETIQKIKALLTRAGWTSARPRARQSRWWTSGSTRRAPARERSSACSPSARRAGRSPPLPRQAAARDARAGEGVRRLAPRDPRRPAPPPCRRYNHSAAGRRHGSSSRSCSLPDRRAARGDREDPVRPFSSRGPSPSRIATEGIALHLPLQGSASRALPVLRFRGAEDAPRRRDWTACGQNSITWDWKLTIL